MKRSDIEELLNNWLYWIETRRFYAPPIPPNMLARMQVDRRASKEPPNARNDALCAAFNMVIAISETDERLPFLYVYLPKYRPTPLKTLADEMHITRETVYQKAHIAAEKFYNRSLRLMQENSTITKIPEFYED